MKKRFRPGDILAIYCRAPLKARLHILLRYLTCPFRKVEPHVPKDGTILEIGCGHGLFCHILARTAQGRRLIGIDIDGDKIALAAPTAGERISFRKIDFLEMDGVSPDAVVLADVLYLIPEDIRHRMLDRIYAILPPGGRLVLKTTDNRPRWKYGLALVQENLAVRVFKITEGERIHFPGAEALKRTLQEFGFSVKIVTLDRGYTYPHCLLLADKPRSDDNHSPRP